jgi:hypothetical protein
MRQGSKPQAETPQAARSREPGARLHPRGRYPWLKKCDATAFYGIVLIVDGLGRPRSGAEGDKPPPTHVHRLGLLNLRIQPHSRRDWCRIAFGYPIARWRLTKASRRFHNAFRTSMIVGAISENRRELNRSNDLVRSSC